MSSVVIPPPDRIEADVEHLKDWMAKEPHLPSIDDKEWLKTFLYNNKFSLEKTKSKLDCYYSVRSKYSEYFLNRDPTGSDIEQIRRVFKHSMGSKPTKDGLQVLHMKYEGDPSAFDTTAYIKRVTMHWDLVYLDPANRLSSFIMIVDCDGFKPMHTFKVLTVLSALSECLNAYTIRNEASHIINCPSFGHAVLEAATKIMPDKLSARVYVHKSTDSLFEMVDEELVCSDFGGKGPSLDDLEDQTFKKLKEVSDWFKKQNGVCSNEALRSKDSNQTEAMRGSFRQLEFD